MSSSSFTSYTSAAGADDAGWTRVPSRSRFSGDAAAAFGSKQRHVSHSYQGFSEEASSAFGRRSAAASTAERLPSRSSGFSTAFSEEAASAFGAAKPASRPGRRNEFDESATSAFGGGSAKRYESSYRSAAAPAPAPAKKQTYDEAFPTLGSTPTATAPAETEIRAPTLAEKLRKRAAEEAEAEERHKAASDAAALRYAREAKERAMFASLSASRAYMGASHYMDAYPSDDPHSYGGDDLDYGAFGEAVEKPFTRRAPSPIPDHEFADDEGY